MRLVEVTISGFRGYKSPMTVTIDEQLTALVGRNDVGKSTIVEALALFFGSKTRKLDQNDFSVGLDEPVQIICGFKDFPEKLIIDSSSETTLAKEYLLGGDGVLRIGKRWTRSKLTAPTLFVRAYHPVWEERETSIINEKHADLKKTAQALNVDEPADARVSAQWRHAIWSRLLSVGDALLAETEVSLSASDGKAVGDELVKYLPHFHLFSADQISDDSDRLAQDPAKAVVKTVLDNNATQLRAVTDKIQQEIATSLEAVTNKLGELAPEYAGTFTVTDPDPEWSKAFSSLRFEDHNGVPLAKRGSGVRRLVMLSFFRAQVEESWLDDEEASETYARGVIIAVEEPETALHADLQLEALDALQEIASRHGRQILITTHSANLVRVLPPSAIRYLVRSELGTKAIGASDPSEFPAFLRRIGSSLGMLSDHSVNGLLFVEGRNDIDGLMNLSAAVAKIDSTVQPFIELRSDGKLAILVIGGCGNASLWENALAEINRPEIYILDSDKESDTSEMSASAKSLKQKETASRLVRVLDRREMENYLTPESIAEEYQALVGFNLDLAEADWNFADIPTVVAKAVHSAADGETDWADLSEKSQKDKESKAKKRLARCFSHASVAEALVHESNDLLGVLREISETATNRQRQSTPM